MSSFSWLPTSFVVILVGIGCSTSETNGEATGHLVDAKEETVAASALIPGAFKLYGSPAPIADKPSVASCDVFTELTLSLEGASLREATAGACDTRVEPDPREYRLDLAGTSCGSRIFRGNSQVAGKPREITITDHRTRVCRDRVPAKIIVEETNAAGAKRMRFSHEPKGTTPTSTWLALSPRQCGANPWAGAVASGTSDRSSLTGEASEVDVFFRKLGIKLEQIGFAPPPESPASSACSAPRGDLLIVHAGSSSDARRLVSDFGFAPAEGALVRSPTQCNTNPWESEPVTNESDALLRWAESLGVHLRAAAFVDYTEPRVVCMACSCPRGDLAVVFSEDSASTSRLEDLGFQRVEN